MQAGRSPAGSPVGGGQLPEGVCCPRLDSVRPQCLCCHSEVLLALVTGARDQSQLFI